MKWVRAVRPCIYLGFEADHNALSELWAALTILLALPS